MRLVPRLLLLGLLGLASAAADDGVERISTRPLGPEPKRWHVPCSDHYAEEGGLVEGCHPTDCRRVIHDGFIGPSEVDRLISIAERAMAAQPSTGGPCIADINSGAGSIEYLGYGVFEGLSNTHLRSTPTTGYVLAGSNLINIYSDEAASPIFDGGDYNFYKGVIERIKSAIDEEFGVQVWTPPSLRRQPNLPLVLHTYLSSIYKTKRRSSSRARPSSRGSWALRRGSPKASTTSIGRYAGPNRPRSIDGWTDGGHN